MTTLAGLIVGFLCTTVAMLLLRILEKRSFERGYFEGYAECMEQWQSRYDSFEPPF